MDMNVQNNVFQIYTYIGRKWQICRAARARWAWPIVILARYLEPENENDGLLDGENRMIVCYAVHQCDWQNCHCVNCSSVHCV